VAPDTSISDRAHPVGRLDDRIRHGVLAQQHIALFPREERHNSARAAQYVTIGFVQTRSMTRVADPAPTPPFLVSDEFPVGDRPSDARPRPETSR
jgi:hypothetical protein